jgi:hypothetical protein
VSLSSVESIVEEEEEPRDETNEEVDSETATTTINASSPQPIHPIDVDEEQEISQRSENLVDLTMSPERTPPPTTTSRRQSSISTSSKPSPTSARKDPVQRYKNIAKKHKRRVQMLESQRREQSQKEATLLEQRKDANVKLEKVEQDLETMEREGESDQLELGHLRLMGVRLKNENTKFTSELQEHKKRTKTAEAEFRKLRESYKAGLEDARSTSMAEVKHILDQYPIITVENQELRERYRKLKSQMESISKHLPSEHQAFSSSKPIKRKRDSDVAKDLRQMQEAYIPGGGELRRTNSKEPPLGLSASSAQKYSSQALRMSSAGQKKASRTTSAVLADMERNGVNAKPVASLGKSKVLSKWVFEESAAKSRGSLTQALGRQKSPSLPLASTSLNFASKKKFSPFPRR